jgi:predicted AlkP superfamily phosphohydrolase/phosphomutase/tetratricopeptide (TPR) repeat protein
MSDRLAKRVLLIGWDAADWRFLQELMDRGRMPALESLMDRGVSGKISTLYPIISPILWNSIATGKRADKHGIFGFVEPDGRGGVRNVTSTSRRAKALWNILSQQGLRSCVVAWYASHPAEPVRGCVFSDRFHGVNDPDPDKCNLPAHSIQPPELEELARELRMHSRQITLAQLAPFFPTRLPDFDKDARPGFLAKILAECASVHNAATLLAEDEEWDFLAVYYDAIDHTGHGFMEYHPPRMPHVPDDDFEIYQHVISGVYQYHDMMLGRLLEIAGAETTVILLSDHGFHHGDQRPAVDAHDASPAAKFGGMMNPLAWHRPQGVFVAAGPGIRANQFVHGASLLDVAPTVLALLGLPIAADMDGRALTQIFDHPVALDIVPSYEEPHPDDGVWREVPAEDTDPFAAQQALKQLAELGYVEAPTGNAQRDLEQTIFEWRNNQAQAYYASGRIAEACAILQQLLPLRDVPHLRCRLALCLMSLDRPDEAEPLLRDVIARFPQMALAQLLLSQWLLHRGELEAAHAAVRELAALDPQQPAMHVHLGNILLRKKQLPEAETAFRRAIVLDDDNPEARDGLGLVLMHTGRLEDAACEFMRAAVLAPHRALFHLHLGSVLAGQGQADWAIRAFETALEQNPNLPFAHDCLSRLHREFKKDFLKTEWHALAADQLRRQAVTGPPV